MFLLSRAPAGLFGSIFIYTYIEIQINAIAI